MSVEATDGRTLNGRVDEPKGDPGNTLSRAEIDTKARALAASSGAVKSEEMDDLMDRLWAVADRSSVERLLPETFGSPVRVASF